MQKNDDDQSLDRLLRQALPELMTSGGPDACVDAEIVAAWTEGALPGSQAALVETHLSRCARCQHLVAALVRTAPSMPAATPAQPRWRRWRLQWLVPIAAAATSVALWVAVPDDQQAVVSQPSSDEPAALELGKQEQPARDARPESDAVTELSRQAGRSSVEPDNSARASSEVGARADADATSRADVREGNQIAASNEPLAQEAARAPSAPAAAPPAASVTAPAEEREASVQRLASASLEIVSPNPASRWRIVAGTRVERSTTAGDAWEPAAITVQTELMAGSSPDPLVCWLVGRAGAVWLTTDGTRFERVPFPASVNLVGVRATSENSVVVTAADGRTFRTDNRGTTWRLER